MPPHLISYLSSLISHLSTISTTGERRRASIFNNIYAEYDSLSDSERKTPSIAAPPPVANQKAPIFSASTSLSNEPLPWRPSTTKALPLGALMDIADDLLFDIFTEWLLLEDVCRLDSAICQNWRKRREEFLRILSSKVLLFNRESLDNQFQTHRALGLPQLKWILRRKIHLAALCLAAESVAREDKKGDEMTTIENEMGMRTTIPFTSFITISISISFCNFYCLELLHFYFYFYFYFKYFFLFVISTAISPHLLLLFLCSS
jgi:hypothetical protein